MVVHGVILNHGEWRQENGTFKIIQGSMRPCVPPPQNKRLNEERKEKSLALEKKVSVTINGRYWGLSYSRRC